MRCISGYLYIVIIFSLLLHGCSSEDKINIEQSAEVAAVSKENLSSNPTEADRAVSVNSSLGEGITAIYEAEDDDRYLFVFFYKEGNEKTETMRDVFDEAMIEVSERANSVAIEINDPNEVEIIAKYGVANTLMPLVLVIAPNGAITGGFPSEFNEKQLVEAIVSTCFEKCLKALQDRKLVFLCVQNSKTKSNSSAMRGVNDFKSDARFAQSTEIVSLDPSDESEVKFLKSLQIDPMTNVAVTAFLAPPGSVVAKYNGPTDKDKFVAKIMGASSGGCGPIGGSSCGPSGCP